MKSIKQLELELQAIKNKRRRANMKQNHSDDKVCIGIGNAWDKYATPHRAYYTRRGREGVRRRA